MDDIVPAETTYTCSSCKKKVKFEDIRYAADGKKLLCAVCFKKNEKSKKTSEENTLNAKKSSGTPDVPKQKPETLKVTCVDCKYKFSLKKGSKPRCPYCGGERIMRDDQFSAEKLLGEVSGSEEDTDSDTQ